ncbi:MAG: Fe2+-dependent dioxygenase [Pseudomonadota bacterium]
MHITITNLLEPQSLQSALALLPSLIWRDGQATAGRVARQIKQNEQADLSTAAGKQLNEVLRTAIQAHPVLRAAARPKRYSKLLVSKTSPGGGYGTHTDNALMGTGSARMRSDLSFTLFLSAPDQYERGDLVIETAGETRRHRLPAGSLVLYPSGHLHRVDPVTAGERIVCVGWIESLIRGQEQRDILFDLENLRADLAEIVEPQSAQALILSKSISNLLRLWSQP